jgi:hypothetical protein
VDQLDVLGDLLGIFFVLLFFALMIGFALAARRRPQRELREIPAFQRLRRAVGLSVEEGTRLHISIGRGSLLGLPGASALIGLTTLERGAHAASMGDRPPVATSGDGVLNILSQDTLRGAYRDLGVEHGSVSHNGRLSGLTPFGYAAGALSTIHDEHVTVNVLAGHFGAEVALLTEAAERTDSLIVGGSDNIAAQAILYAAAQGPLLGEELFAAGAYLGAGPMHAASLRVQDILRWGVIAAIILGGIAKLGGWL